MCNYYFVQRAVSIQMDVCFVRNYSKGHIICSAVRTVQYIYGILLHSTPSRTGDHSIFPKFATCIHSTFLRRRECYRFTSNQSKALRCTLCVSSPYVVTFTCCTLACVASMIFGPLSVYHLYGTSTSNATRKTQQCGNTGRYLQHIHPPTGIQLQSIFSS